MTTTKPVCEICHQGPEHGIAVYRLESLEKDKPEAPPHYRCSVDFPEGRVAKRDVIEPATDVTVKHPDPHQH